jgi:hypothetical protein
MSFPNTRPRTAAGRNAIATLMMKRCAPPIGERITQHRPEAPAILPADCEHRTGLDEHLEGLAFFIIEIEEIGDKDQMAGARDRQELGQAFDESKDECFEQRYHFHGYSHRARVVAV